MKADIRCDCGRLLARRTLAGIEIKCRRCHRQLEIRLDDLGDELCELELAPDSGRRSIG